AGLARDEHDLNAKLFHMAQLILREDPEFFEELTQGKINNAQNLLKMFWFNPTPYFVLISIPIFSLFILITMLISLLFLQIICLMLSLKM
ncbi:MAG: hypothetical protein QXI93_01595, partial [Candidatus Methanomethylicia archaeon]